MNGMIKASVNPNKKGIGFSDSFDNTLIDLKTFYDFKTQQAIE